MPLLDASETEASKEQLEAHDDSTPTINKLEPRKFYDYGIYFHDMDFSCPVPWEWVSDPMDAEVLWYNVLEHAIGLEDETSMPQRLHPDQRLAFFSMESGQHYPVVYDAKLVGFDFSVDYRIWPDHPEGPADVPVVYYLRGVQIRAPTRMPKRTDALMAAFISNCNSDYRLTVLDELMELMPVHSYGKCFKNADMPRGRRTDGGGNRAKKVEVLKDYRFTFAAENINETSYVTEKVYDALEAGSLPVYWGAPDIDRFLPHPSAAIKMPDFASVQDLAAYLLELAEDDAKYQKHFEWKKMKEFAPDFQRVERLAGGRPYSADWRW